MLLWYLRYGVIKCILKRQRAYYSLYHVTFGMANIINNYLAGAVLTYSPLTAATRVRYPASACGMVMWSPSQTGGFPLGTPVSSHTTTIRTQTSVPIVLLLLQDCSINMRELLTSLLNTKQRFIVKNMLGIPYWLFMMLLWWSKVPALSLVRLMSLTYTWINIAIHHENISVLRWYELVLRKTDFSVWSMHEFLSFKKRLPRLD